MELNANGAVISPSLVDTALSHSLDKWEWKMHPIQLRILQQLGYARTTLTSVEGKFLRPQELLAWKLAGIPIVVDAAMRKANIELWYEDKLLFTIIELATLPHLTEDSNV